MVRKRTPLLVSFSTTLVLLLLATSPLAAEEEPESGYYIVQKGDNLFRISRKYSISLDQLLAHNPQIEDPDTVKEGTRLRIPPGADPQHETTVHVVEVGDNLYRLSLRYGVDIDALAAANGLTEESILKVGDELRIPASSPLASTGSEGPAGGHATAPPEPVSANRVDPSVWKNGVPFWPHGGEVKILEGELFGKLSPGVQIDGSEGDRVVSVSSGTVEWASPYRGFGKVVIVKHHSGRNYVYGGIGELFVNPGDRVTVGTDLGLLGAYHSEPGARLFFWVTKDGDFSEPHSAPRD